LLGKQIVARKVQIGAKIQVAAKLN
jgi:hypothetical protein